MASHKITISTEAYKRLKGHKLGSESFSEVILREVALAPAIDAGEVLDRAKEFEGQQLLDEKHMRRILARKRAPKRLRHAA
jgi:predicted CopG family antitoxin